MGSAYDKCGWVNGGKAQASPWIMDVMHQLVSEIKRCGNAQEGLDTGCEMMRRRALVSQYNEETLGT